MAIILPANTLSAGGYTVANSCRFNTGDTAYMHYTPSSGGNRKTWTFSGWYKRASLTDNARIFGADTDSPNRVEMMLDNGSGVFRLELLTSGNDGDMVTTQVFRDVSAWYHVVVAVDTTQGTASNRIKLYINGTQVTSFSTETYGDQDKDYEVNHTIQHMVGKSVRYGSPYDGYMAEVVLIDGTAYAASDFGEFDEDSPTIWKPKDVSELTFGTNGFYLDFKDSANLGNDVSGNNNDLTEVNLAATDSATDTPTNNWCTLNPLTTNNSNYTFAEGNLKVTSSVAWVGSLGTIAMASGKWYWEIKQGTGNIGVGIGQLGNDATETIKLSTANVGYSSKYSRGYEYFRNGSNSWKMNNDTYATYGSVPSDGDILMIAFDADNGTIWVGLNGTWHESATEGEIEAGTTTNAMYSSINMDQPYLPTASMESANMSFNFGNPAYANSSDAADENGYGAFEYAPPSGYYALCTKNLAEFG